MLYLRDLRNELREDIEKIIRSQRPDLANDMEFGDDILIGEIFKAKDFKIAE